MSSLTESSLIFNSINPDNKNDKNDKKDWYNRVYLCCVNNKFPYVNSYGPIKGFNCYRFLSLENALAWKQNYNKSNQNYTIIPICKWVPQIFDKYILDWKLKKKFG